MTDQSKILLPATIRRNERIVQAGLWKKLAKMAGQLPFAEDVAAAYFCVLDSNTPSRVRAMLLAALAYFVLPLDAVPDFLAGIGFGDDAAVIAGTIALVSKHISPLHRQKARKALDMPPPSA